MKSFAVRCPVPEVFEMLRALALKAGYGGNTTRTSEWFYIGNAGTIEAGSGAAVRGIGGNMLDEISIEAAIAELTKPREKPIIIGCKTLSFPGDGSIKLSCGETIPASVCEEIEKRRKVKPASRVVWFGSESIASTVWRCVDGGVAEYFGSRGFEPCSAIHTENYMRQKGIPEITAEEAKRRCPAAFQEAK